MTYRPSRAERIRLFENAVLERLTLTPLWLFVAVWTVVVGGLSCQVAADGRPTATTAGLILGGWLLWTLFEYVMHSLLFHLRPSSTYATRLIFLLHGNHHQEPTDPLRNLIPPGLGVTVAAGFWLLFFRLLPEGTRMPLFLGFVVGYVAYDLLHFACHQSKMPGRFLTPIKRHHLLHHYTSSDGNYSVTFIAWDRLFGTRLRTRARR